MHTMVWENADGKVFLSYNSAKYVFGTIYERHGVSYSEESVAKIESALAAIADQAVK